ncbi:MAG TPA: hypothetical protein VIK86_01900 [Candidatus Paceibacterota bacterium]
MSKKNSLTCMQFFVTNLNSYMAFKKINSVRLLAKDLTLNYKRVESWIYFSKTPSIITLDIVADRMNVLTYDLIGKKIFFLGKDKKTIIANNSPPLFCRNLRKFLNKIDIKSADEFSSYFEEKISKHTYYSYFRKSNPMIPSLKTAEEIAELLGLQLYDLIKRGDL